MPNELVPQEVIESKIYVIRGHKVMLDRDLAMLYGVETRVLNQSVTRNKDRFPDDFMFQLTKTEVQSLRSQLVTSKNDGCLRSQIVILEPGKYSKYLPNVFTEQGVAMLSSVLASPRAIEVNIAIMRAFVRLRTIVSAHKELAEKLRELERKIGRHDKEIIAIFEVIKQLAEPLTERKKRRIGFRIEGVGGRQ